MKISAILLCSAVLCGCATTKEQLYYDAAKAISKDNTVSQTACFAAVTEIAKGGDSGAKVGAITLADRCKNEVFKIEPPKRNWIGL
ncbi:MAG: hypothetical protein EBR82_44555 [Caulobacteraceae bacterium]|nr:hypothetical protein [Caulobacteraceae bacterium]